MSNQTEQSAHEASNPDATHLCRPVELRTPRLLLRQWKDDDLEAWATMNADPAVRRFFPSVHTHIEALGEAGRIRASITQRGWGMWAVEVPGVHTFAGFVGLNIPGYEAPWMPAVEIGWRLAPAAWHQGYATEGAAAALLLRSTVRFGNKTGNVPKAGWNRSLGFRCARTP